MSRRGRRLGLFCLLALFAGCHPTSCGAFLSPPDEPRSVSLPSLTAASTAGRLQVGAARVDVTPPGAVWMGGFGFCKASEGVHDPITARAIALRRGEVTAVVVGCDVIGLHNYQIELIRERLRGVVTRDAVLVAATHTHAGPDTLGMWGLLPPLLSGLEDEVVARVLVGIESAACQAVAALEPATVRWGQAQAPPRGISKNSRDPQLIDRTVTAVGFDRLDGKPIATLVHFACHPESLGSKNRQLSADFPAGIYSAVEAARPGVCVYLNGPLGGMVTTDEQDHSFAEAERIGADIGALALGALEAGQPLPEAVELLSVRRPVWLPVENRRFHLGQLFGIFGPRVFEGGHTLSEVMALALGPLVLLTAPGEVLPRLGFELDALNRGTPSLLVGLGGDELGYLIHEEDWDEERYHYERTVSLGPLASVVVRETAREVLAELELLRAGERGR